MLGLLLVLLGTHFLSAQVITGRITNEFREPLPYANVYIQQLQTGTVSDDEGMYSFNFDVEGEYNLVFSSLGYESVSERVTRTPQAQEVNPRMMAITSGLAWPIKAASTSSSGRLGTTSTILVKKLMTSSTTPPL